MKGQKGKLVNAMGMAIAITIALSGCSEKTTDGLQSPEKTDNLLPEGLQDISGIFDLSDGAADSQSSGLLPDEEAPTGQQSGSEQITDLEQTQNHQNRYDSNQVNQIPSDIADSGAFDGNTNEQSRQSTLPVITEVPTLKLLTSEFSTWYGSSSASRCNNIERAAKLINGTVIAPGEVFSCRDAISPLTEENGYQSAGTYVEGKVEESIGGGVCQISSTLYNAALLAGLTIVERAPHSMAVSYVDPGRDAAIAGDYKDLKLKNDFAYPVMLEATTEEGTLRLVVHTAEEDTGARVELVSVIISRTEPGEPVITVDDTKPDDYYMVTQKAHTGYTAELYRVVWRGDTEVLRVLVNTSSYVAAPEYVTVGRANQTE